MKTRLSQSGFTLLELMVALSLSGILMGIAAANVRAYNCSSKNAVSMIQGFVKLVRAKGISRTAAYKIYPDPGGKKILTSFANTCSDSIFTVDNNLTLDMPEQTKLLIPTWTTCLNSRGLANANVIISFSTKDAGTKQLEIMLGGGTREL